MDRYTKRVRMKRIPKAETVYVDVTFPFLRGSYDENLDTVCVVMSHDITVSATRDRDGDLEIGVYRNEFEGSSETDHNLGRGEFSAKPDDFLVIAREVRIALDLAIKDAEAIKLEQEGPTP